MSDAVNILDTLIANLRHTLRTMEQNADSSRDTAAYEQAHANLRETIVAWEDVQVALAQGVELALHVERSAKGTLAQAAAKVLSVPYAAELRHRLTTAPAWRFEVDHDGLWAAHVPANFRMFITDDPG